MRQVQKLIEALKIRLAEGEGGALKHLPPGVGSWVDRALDKMWKDLYGDVAGAMKDSMKTTGPGGLPPEVAKALAAHLKQLIASKLQDLD